MKLAILKYHFMLDPSKTFAHAYEFESLFSKFLKEHNLVAEVIETLAGSGPDKFIWIKPSETLVVEAAPKQGDSMKFLEKARKVKSPKKDRPKKVRSIVDMLAVSQPRENKKQKSGSNYLGQVRIR